MNQRVLVLYAHPLHARSQVNAALREAIQTLSGVTLHDLYETYPEFVVDVAREQALLLEHEVVLLQFPLQWYSAPAMIKEWLDAVLEEGWAYGQRGDKLRGKAMMCAVSAGGASDVYGPDGVNRYTVEELLRPFELTARLCGMRYLRPFVTFAARRLDDAVIAVRAREYADMLAQIVSGELPAPFDSRSR